MDTTTITEPKGSPRNKSRVDSKLPVLLADHEAEILSSWTQGQLKANTLRSDLLSESDLKNQSARLLSLVRKALNDSHQYSNIDGSEWNAVKEFLNEVSTVRAEKGFTPTETAMFVFSLKQPIFDLVRKEFEKYPASMAEELWTATVIVDKLGLYCAEVFTKGRESLIARQQNEMLELSTPVIQLWHGILALPMIGTLDSSRTQIVTETLLQRIVETGSQVAIIDITGVPTVDTLVAQHLLKTVAAARLMGAECIISGIRPQIAATIVHLGVDLGSVATKASLADAFKLALIRTSQTFGKAKDAQKTVTG